MENWFGKIFGGSDKSDSPEVTATKAGMPHRVAGNPTNAGRKVHRGDPDGPELPSVLAAGEWAQGQELLDDFVVERTLGEGGMGKVYLLCSRSTASRFAVKRAKGFKEADRRNFLAELQTWIDLPEHANLVPCRFFRTLGDEVLIFAEYVEGGSLKEWIASRKLYEGSGARQALERMLDVAIQFAWGLHCLHELGLVHQDVKPGNVLMGADGKTALQEVRARVTDYGLARARAAAGETFSTDPSRSILFSSGGGTPAYWSPEQAAGLPITRKTDIWSWGVSVLEMFTGEVTWRSGQGAAEVIEQHLRQGGYDEAIPAMPDRLSELLRQCFREKPPERPTSLGEAADRLKVIYQESVGRDYSRNLNVIERAALSQTGIKERRTAFGCVWKDPQEWLEKALRAAGRDPAEAATMVAGRGVTRQGELVAEMAAYDEAKRLYLQLVRGGKNELEMVLAILCGEKALVHWTAADLHGALQEYDQAIAILERLVNQEGRRELAKDLATVYTNKAVVVSDLGDDRGAVALYDQAIAIRERLVNQEGRRELADSLATVYTNKANAVSALGDDRGAVALLNQAIAILERLVNQEGRRELAKDLAAVYMTKAISVSALGDDRGAVTLYDQAIAIRERLVNQEGRRELADDLARVYTNKAVAVGALGDHRGAVALLNQAIAIRERLVNQEGRRELVGDLARLKAYRGEILITLGEKENGLQDMRSAQSILDAEVARTGRTDLKQYLTFLQQQLTKHSA